jgi:hypothetical protein
VTIDEKVKEKRTVIDVHARFWGKGYLPNTFHMATAQAEAVKETGRGPEMILPKIKEGLVDTNGELFIRIWTVRA